MTLRTFLELLLSSIPQPHVEVSPRRKRALPSHPLPFISRDKSGEVATARTAGETVQAVARPQCAGFRLRSIDVHDAERWIIEDVKIGNRSQFLQMGSIRATLLSGKAFRFDPCLMSMDITIVARYIGPTNDAVAFEAIGIGDSVEIRAVDPEDDDLLSR